MRRFLATKARKVTKNLKNDSWSRWIPNILLHALLCFLWRLVESRGNFRLA
jgi:hypothetical protein